MFVGGECRPLDLQAVLIILPMTEGALPSTLRTFVQAQLAESRSYKAQAAPSPPAVLIVYSGGTSLIRVRFGTACDG
jgi:hypothetical protein